MTSSIGPVGMSSWSRAESAPLATASAGGAAPPLLAHPDTEALSEFLSAAPRDAGAATREDGGTLIGTDTKMAVPDDAARLVAPPAPGAPKGRIDLGETTMPLGPGSPVGGQAYFITDGEPVNAMGLIEPLLSAIGLRPSRFGLPVLLAYAAALLGEVLYLIPGMSPPPLTVSEVRNVTVSHTASIAKARRDLGYTPLLAMPQAIERCLPYCRALADQGDEGVVRDHAPKDAEAIFDGIARAPG